jgi:hypothetical protein
MRTLFHTALIRRVFRNGTADARRHSRIGPCRHRARRTVRCRASHADWLFGLCVMMEDGEPIPGQAGTSGSPTIRGFALPAHEWLIEDTWYVAGLKGTGSNHIALTDKLVPAANFFDLDGPSCAPGSLYRGLLPSLPLLHGAFAVGMAQARSTNCWRWPIPGGSNCAPLRRCGTRRRSSLSWDGLPPMFGQCGRYTTPRWRAIGSMRLPEQ